MSESSTEERDPPSFELGPVGIWSGHLDFVPMARSRELVVEVEELGYGAVWLPELAGRDVFAHLAFLLDATEHIVGCTGIANIWGRDAVTMTGGLEALAEAFPDRVLLGLGVSHQPLVEKVRGHRYHRPLSAMRTYLEAMDAAPYYGHRPHTKGRRVLGALGPKMLALARDAADGAHPYFVTPEHTATARDILGEGPLLCPEQAVVLEDDPVRAREIARSHTSTYVRFPNYLNNLRGLGFEDADFVDGGSDRLIDAIVAWGSVDQIRARVESHLDAGADHVAIQALSEGRETPEDQWRELAPALTGLR